MEARETVSRWAVLAVSVMLAACADESCDSPSAPGPPTTTTTSAPPEPAKPPRVDVDFQWDTFAGYTAFGLGHPGQTEQEVRSLISAGMLHGFNTARVCAETEFWDNDPPYLTQKPRDFERLRWLLDIFATVPGAQVLLVGDCTLKGPVAEEEKRDWARSVAALSAIYANVAIETHNEFDNCRGRGWGPHCPGKQDVAEHIRIYKEAGFEYVTADDRLCKNDFSAGNIGFRLANVGAWPADFHPCRDYPIGSKKPWDPSLKNLRDLARANGMVLLSETVALGDFSGTCDGLRTCDRDRIQSYVDRCAQVDAENGERGCKFIFHSERLLAGWLPEWWPEAK